MYQVLSKIDPLPLFGSQRTTTSLRFFLAIFLSIGCSMGSTSTEINLSRSAITVLSFSKMHLLMRNTSRKAKKMRCVQLTLRKKSNSSAWKSGMKPKASTPAFACDSRRSLVYKAYSGCCLAWLNLRYPSRTSRAPVTSTSSKTKMIQDVSLPSRRLEQMFSCLM